jgi:hypothetical protein
MSLSSRKEVHSSVQSSSPIPPMKWALWSKKPSSGGCTQPVRKTGLANSALKSGSLYSKGRVSCPRSYRSPRVRAIGGVQNLPIERVGARILDVVVVAEQTVDLDISGVQLTLRRGREVIARSTELHTCAEEVRDQEITEGPGGAPAQKYPR